MIKLYSPGPDGNSGDNWNEHPLDVDAQYINAQQ